MLGFHNNNMVLKSSTRSRAESRCRYYMPTIETIALTESDHIWSRVPEQIRTLAESPGARINIRKSEQTPPLRKGNETSWDSTNRPVFLTPGRREGPQYLQDERRKPTDEQEEYYCVIVNENSQGKIPRPPNAFMVFANKFRRTLAARYPKDSNKDISVRLGHLWKMMDATKKVQYFELAKQASTAHKQKYPDYVYNPKQARLQKALRDTWRQRSKRGSGTQSNRVQSTQPTGTTVKLQANVGKHGNSTETSAESEIGTKQDFHMPILVPGSEMTLSVGAETGYSMMDPPSWNNGWFPYRHGSVPYLGSHYPETSEALGPFPDPLGFHYSQHRGDSTGSTSSSSCSVKGPLTQLQELTNVLQPTQESSCHDKPQGSPFEDAADISHGSGAAGSSSRMSCGKPEGVDCIALNHDSDSGYVTDHHAIASNASQVSNDPDVVDTNKLGASDVLLSQPEHRNSIQDNRAAGMDPLVYNCLDDVFLGSYVGKTTLPGFQQAFGSTEIGRFSRNDFFANAPPCGEVSDEGAKPLTPPPMQTQPTPRQKPARKPRKVKAQAKKSVEDECSCAKTPDQCMSAPGPGAAGIPRYSNQVPSYCEDGASYHNERLAHPMFPHPYDNYPKRYGCPEYSNYPYYRNDYPSSYYDYHCFRPFGFPLDYGQSWSGGGPSPGWTGHPQPWVPQPPPPQPAPAPPQPSHYSPYNSWTSSNMFPFMRLDY